VAHEDGSATPKGQNPSIFIFSAMEWPNHPIGHPRLAMPFFLFLFFKFFYYFFKFFIFIFLYSATYQRQQLTRGNALKFGRKIL
jgi:hypothetical protein